MRRRDGRGSAAVLAVSLLTIVVLVTAGISVVGGIFRAHRQAQAAADLAALAGAVAASEGGDACGEAAAIAQANGSVLVACDVSGGVVTVDVSAEGPSYAARSFDVASTARAGPSDALRDWAKMRPVEDVAPRPVPLVEQVPEAPGPAG